MLSLTLFRKTLRTYWKLIAAFLAILTMYLVIIAGMFDPESLDVVEMLASMKLSPELLAAFGFTLTDATLTGFLSSYFYGMLMLALPMIVTITVANGTVAKLVDRGSLSCLLSTPLSRRKIAVTQAVFLALSAAVLVAWVTGVGIVYCEATFPGLLDISAFVRLNLAALALHLAVSGISFFASCLFNESRTSLALGAGLPIVFLVVQMLSNANPDSVWLKRLTLFSLFRPTELIGAEYTLAPVFVLLGVAIVLYTAGVFVFDRKDLPI